MMKKLLTLLLILAASLPLAAKAPKYIFYFIGDGMGMSHVQTTEAYNRSVLHNPQPILMLQFPTVSYATSYSASSDITDSAAAGTALSTGVKTRNGMIAMTPDSIPAESIASKLFKKGWGVGVVTTVPPDDATPSVFYAHQPSRSMFYEIGREAATCGYEFIGGSRWRGMKDKQGKPTDLRQLFIENGVETFRDAKAAANSRSRRVVLLNTDTVAHALAYAIDENKEHLALTDMVSACLAHLEKTSPKKFFMMAEAGTIDYAAHSNDGGGVVRETLAFQDAIRIAYDFYLAHPQETLIVITADHNTGGMALANTFLHYEANLKAISSQKISKDRFSDWCKRLLKDKTPITWEQMKEVLGEKLGYWKTVTLTPKQEKYIHEEFDRTFAQGDSEEHKTLYNTSNNFVEAVFDTFNDIAGIGFTAESHSGDFVPVFAIGAGADLFQGFHDNTDIPKLIYKAATQK